MPQSSIPSPTDLLQSSDTKARTGRTEMGPAPTKPSIELAGFDAILGQSVATEEIYEFGKRAASVDAPVLITGESGTGKGLLARATQGGSEMAANAANATH